jgi:hypothetical protein
MSSVVLPAPLAASAAARLLKFIARATVRNEGRCASLERLEHDDSYSSDTEGGTPLTIRPTTMRQRQSQLRS